VEPLDKTLELLNWRKYDGKRDSIGVS